MKSQNEKVKKTIIEQNKVIWEITFTENNILHG